MSTLPKISDEPTDRLAVTLPRLAEKKRQGEAIVMVTAYDFPSGQIVDAAGVDLVLVGDSGAEVVLGHPSTVAVGMEEMLMLAAAARRGVRGALLVADMPFGSYEESDAVAIRNAQRFVKEAGADAVKLEGGGEAQLSRIRAIVGAGVMVMGHVGLTPQTATALGGRRAQGRTAERALELARQAAAVQEAGAFAIVFEAIPAAVAAAITKRLEIPVIGIGAGAATDGQVLVLHDMLGVFPGSAPRFAKQYVELRSQMTAAVAEFAAEVRSRRFPAAEHTFSIDPAELLQFSAGLGA
ncbi:MAG TPA: 3-methyl-2-oxobutanoate hydroxymethyltransferase [Solirubrobacteraceae bacterium]|jgi:3-methyl-2-oxobutanoate hydroxymethyltransferase|nr:3-methyl-2-oxobutanoate hydroxymethyltransferase [Solirubrobacteraceae bacterium]